MVSTINCRGLVCAICLEEWPEEDDLCPQLPPHLRQTALKCGHIFHQECKENLINASQRQSIRCPLCRAIEPITPSQIGNENLSSSDILHITHTQLGNRDGYLIDEYLNEVTELPMRINARTYSGPAMITTNSTEQELSPSLSNYNLTSTSLFISGRVERIDSNGIILSEPASSQDYPIEFSFSASSSSTLAPNRFWESSSIPQSTVPDHTNPSRSSITNSRAFDPIHPSSTENEGLSSLDIVHAPHLHIERLSHQISLGGEWLTNRMDDVLTYISLSNEQEIRRGLEISPEEATTSATNTTDEEHLLLSPHNLILTRLSNSGINDSNGIILSEPASSQDYPIELSFYESSSSTSEQNLFLETSSTTRSIVSGYTSLSESPILPDHSVIINEIFNSSFTEFECPTHIQRSPRLALVVEETSFFEPPVRLYESVNQTSSADISTFPIIEDVD